MWADPRNELLHDVEPVGDKVIVTPCPEISIKIEGREVRALLDTGSEVTAISEEFYYGNSNILQKCPALPISGTAIKGAMGGKSNFESSLIFLIIPKLIRPCIIGYDAIKNLQMLINTSKDKISFKIGNNHGEIQFNLKHLASTKYVSLCLTGESAKDEFGSKIDFDSKSLAKNPAELSIEEIDEKLENCGNLKEAQKMKLRALLIEMKEVFEKKQVY